MSTSYKHILRTTSLTGGAQIGKILARLFSAKALAIILGPSGTGFVGLIQSTMQVVTSIFGMGLSFSAVRSIAEVSKSPEKVASIHRVVRFWLLITGVVGTGFTFFFSGWLSEITFGDRSNQYIFQWLSVTVLFAQVSAGQIAVLQGLRKIKDMALAQVSGAFIGLFISIPIYFFFGLSGVIAALITLSVANLLRSAYFLQKQKIPKVIVTWDYIKQQAKPLFSLGLVGLLNGLSATVAGFAIRALLRDYSGDTFAIGIYQAAWVVGVTYLDLIFNAMSADYYPRLTSMKDNWVETNSAIDEQRNLALWLAAPLLVVMILFSHWIIELLYAQSYAPAGFIVSVLSIGIFFKLLSWPIGFLLVVYKKNTLFLIGQIVWQILFLGFFISLYETLGLTSIGVSFSLTYGLYFLFVLIITLRKFPRILFRYSGIKESVLIGAFVFLALVVKIFFFGWGFYVIAGILTLSSLGYSFVKLKPIFRK